MPGGDGTGPMGRGPMTGGGWGCCPGGAPSVYGLGRRLGRGYRRYLNAAEPDGLSQKEILETQKEVLKARLGIISKQLDKLSEEE